MFHGRRAEAEAKNRQLPLPMDELDAIVLSHAHIDHAGRLPLLTKGGYEKSIWATPATRDLSAYMLLDSAHIQESDAEHLARHNKPYVEPLYNTRDAARVLEQMVCVPYNKYFDVIPGVRGMFIEAGHILGSASVILECTENGTSKRLIFSGDIGRKGLSIIKDPEIPQDADVVIMESTYGDRDHAPV